MCNIYGYQFDKRRRIVQISLVLILMLFFFFILLPLSHATLGETLKGWFQEIFGWIFSSHGEIVSKIFDGGMWSFFSAGNESGTQFFNTMNNAVASVAAGLLTVRIFIEIFQAASEDKLNMDFVAKIMVKITIMMLVIVNIGEITTALHDFFNWAMGKLTADGVEAIKNQLNEVMTTMENAKDFGQSLGYVVIFIRLLVCKIILSPLLFILDILIRIGAYALIIELGIRRIFMPIALLGIMTEGPRSPGMRFLKKYAGVYIKMMIYIAAFLLADSLFLAGNFPQPNGEEDILDVMLKGFALEYIAINISAYTFAKKGERLADEIIGV